MAREIKFSIIGQAQSLNATYTQITDALETFDGAIEDNTRRNLNYFQIGLEDMDAIIRANENLRKAMEQSFTIMHLALRGEHQLLKESLTNIEEAIDQTNELPKEPF